MSDVKCVVEIGVSKDKLDIASRPDKTSWTISNSLCVNPRQIRDFAKATGRLAKTDRIDADVIANFGPTLRLLPPKHEFCKFFHYG